MTDETHNSGDQIEVGDIRDSIGVAIGRGASATVNVHNYQPPEFPLDNLPPPNPNFTGREAQLAAIQAALHGQQGTLAITQAITGLGGVGKTQLALAYAHAQRDAYDLMWLLRAEDAPTLDADLRQLGLVLGLPIHSADAETARQAVLAWLNGTDQRWLLLLDNADTIAPRDLRRYLPGGRGHTLITTRRQQWQGAQTLALAVFTPQEAAAFWQNRLVVGASRRLAPTAEPALAELAQELGHLPLALEQAAAYMLARDKTPAAYLRLFRERRAELWAREQPPDDYHATIAATWEMAFDHARQTPGAAALLNLCSFLAPEDIPLDLIVAAAEEPAHPDLAPLADELARDDALAALTTYSLLTRKDGSLTMHRLVQTVTRDRMGEERRSEWATTAIELIYQILPDWQRLHEWDEGSVYLPHMMTTANLAQAQAVETTRLADLCNWTGYYLQFLASYEAARPYYERALAIRETVLGPDQHNEVKLQATALSLNDLGGLLRAMGDYTAARPYHERALAIRETALGPDHPDTAQSLNNLGVLLQAMGDYAAARPYFERALAIYETALGPDHPYTARSLNNLGYLLDSMGDYAAARPYYERALAINETALGPDHPDTAQSLNNLGVLLQAMGDYAAARPYYERALAIRETALGPDHPDTAQSLSSLGVLLQAMGEYAAARPYFERALAIDEKVLGPDHPYTAGSLNNLGELLRAMGDYAGARPYHERALAIRETALGPDHPDTAQSLNNLGYLLQAMGDYAAARPYYERALAIWETALGPDHPDMAYSLNNLGVLLQAMGDYAAARPYYERALAILEAKLGPDHPHTKIVRRNLQSL